MPTISEEDKALSGASTSLKNIGKLITHGDIKNAITEYERRRKFAVSKLNFIIKNDKKDRLMTMPNIIKQFKDIDYITQSHYNNISKGIMIYKNGIYTETNAQNLMYRYIKRGLDYMLSRQKVNDILHILALEKLYDVTKFDNDPNILNCNNGLLDLTTLELSLHTPQYKSVKQIPTNYNPNATCPKITQFLREVVGNEFVDTMFEIVGFCLINDMPLEKMVLLIGGGSNGKSVFLQILEALFGNNTESKSLETLDSNQYAVAYLKDKMVNIGGDISGKKIENSHVFKALTSREKITSEVKYGKAISFHNTCKLIFSANNPPGTSDYSIGFWRRWVLVKFPNTFPEDTSLIFKLTTTEELEGLLIEALKGMNRLLTNNEFTNSLTVEETMRTYNIERGSFYNWFDDNLEYNSTMLISVNELYDNYIKYCKSYNIVTAHTLQGFGSLLSTYVKRNKSDSNYVTKERKTINGKKSSIYIGLQIKEDDPIENLIYNLEVYR